MNSKQLGSRHGSLRNAQAWGCGPTSSRPLPPCTSPVGGHINETQALLVRSIQVVVPTPSAYMAPVLVADTSLAPWSSTGFLFSLPKLPKGLAPSLLPATTETFYRKSSQTRSLPSLPQEGQLPIQMTWSG